MSRCNSCCHCRKCCYEPINHHRYRHCLEVENAALVIGTSATITTAPETYTNKDIYELRYCVCFEDATGAEVLSINNGTTSYPVWDSDGEPVKIGRLRMGEVLKMTFISTAPAHFVINCCCLYCLCLHTQDAGGEL